MNIINKHIFYFSLILLLFYNGCEKNNSPGSSVTFTYDNSEEIIHYLESQGDYINSPNTPSLVEAPEVYYNLNKYLLLDVRSIEDFNRGHISGAINIPPSLLADYIDSSGTSYDSIVIISKNGQASAYYTSLLRLYGFSNVYSLHFGMAAWNGLYSDEWIATRQQLTNELTEDDFKKGPLLPMPQIEFNNPTAPITEKIKLRIKKLLQGDFSESPSLDNNSPSISANDFLDSDVYKICYGSNIFYLYRYEGFLHPAGTINYLPASDLKSTAYLQTLPPNKRICLYSYDGILSAFVTAYLRLLGYNAASVLFGANAFLYYSLTSSLYFSSYAFTSDKINNFPVVE